MIASDNRHGYEEAVIALSGLLISFTGLFSLFFEGLAEPRDLEGYGTILCYILIAFCGMFLVLGNGMGYERCVFVIGTFLGICLILGNLSLDPMNDPMFVLKFMDICLGGLLVILAVSYLLGFRYNVLHTTRIIVVLIVLDVYPLFLGWYMGESVEELISERLTALPILACYCASMFIITRDGIRVVPQMTQLSDNLGRMMDVYHDDGSGYITPQDLDTLLDRQGDRWTEFHDGPVLRETTLRIWHGVENTTFTARIWKMDNRMSLEFDCGPDMSLSDHLMIYADLVVLSDDGGMVTFYDDRGILVRLCITEVQLGDSAVTNTYRVLSGSDLNRYRRWCCDINRYLSQGRLIPHVRCREERSVHR